MCGIAFASGELPSESQRKHAVEALRHRGPDDSGVWEQDDVWIGHTRLEILDLSSAAAQPMHSPDGRFVLAYNGEIYNYVELREDVRRAGWQLHGSGDTEVLLGLLATEGPACLTRLTGMFAFVLWDRERRALLAARDPLGIKPLYYAHDSSGSVVASELRAMIALGRGDRLDRLAVEDVLLTGSVRGPRTILDGVRALAPGSLVEIADGHARERAYWELPDPDSGTRPAPAESELDQRLRESVHVQLRSDVPVGTFLSGGIDSSLITSYAAEELGGDLHTFSVGFEARDPKWDETPAAALVAERYGTRHHRIVVTRSDFQRRMEQLPRAIDQPSADGINSYFISAAAAAEVKVCLSGQGGDELFGGYNIFRFASRMRQLVQRLPQPPAAIRRLAADSRRLPARLQHNWYLRGLVATMTRADPALLSELANPLFGFEEIGAGAPPPSQGDSHADVVDAISRNMLTGYLPNTLLRDMDAMSMWHSLEVRVPLVDPRLAELALSIPGPQKAVWSESKRPLRRLARQRLPARLLELPKKGFTFPLAEWLAHPECLRLLEESLERDEVASAGLVNPAIAEHELARLRSPRPGDLGWLRAQRVWALYTLHAWQREWRAARSAVSG